MNFYAVRFNLYLLLAVVALMGCQTHKHEKKDKHVSMMRFHLENRAQVAETGKTVSVLRSNPVMVTVDSEPCLTELNIVKAQLLETPGGFAIEVKFDERGTWGLEQLTSANSGRHFAIFSQWSDKAKDSRWIAAPIISHRISNGVFSFTADTSREEAEAIVLGLNNMAEKLAKEEMK
jgi:preprotein translocase subunit SecD